MPNRIVQEWISFAHRDLDAARALGKLPNQEATSCFHAQQAAEKALKACFAAEGLTPPKTHDLDVLRETSRFRNKLAQVTEACAVLTMYSVDSRYPGAHIEAEEVQPAIAYAEDVIRTVQAILEGLNSEAPGNAD